MAAGFVEQHAATAGADHQVTLSDDANGLIVADALYLVPSDARNQPFTWSTSLPQAGSYEVYARWPADASRTTAATYEEIQRRLTS